MATRDARKHPRPSEDDETTDDAAEQRAEGPVSEEDGEDPPTPPAAPAEAPNRPPILLMVAIVSIGCLAMLIFALSRGSGSASPALFDKDHDAHVALIGAWRCSSQDGGTHFKETLVLLASGRYTRQRGATSQYASYEEVSGSWQVRGDSILFTAESCTQSSALDAKPCDADHPLVQQLELPITDELKIGESCTGLKRVTKRSGS